MVGQFASAHQGKQPEKIIVEPLALVGLGLKQSVAPVWGGVPVECRDIEVSEIVARGTGAMLGVLFDAHASHIVACEISSARSAEA
jgi:hypothetical protein